MKKQTQRGSTELTIIACLVVVVLFALGWIFWQNFIHKKPVQNETELMKVEKKSASDKETKYEDYKGVTVTTTKGNLSVKIPNGWEVVRFADSDGISYLPNANTVYDESKAPVIKDVNEGGHDSPVGFSVGFDTYDKAAEYRQYTDVTRDKFTLQNGARVERMKSISDGQSYIRAGYTSYRYILTLDGKTLVATWGPQLDATVTDNDVEFVDKVLATVTVK